MPSKTVDQFHSYLRRLNCTRARAERLAHSKAILRTDIESIYEALFLRAFVAFEGLLEAVFFTTMRAGAGGDGTNGPLVTFRSISVMRQIVLEGRKYADWIPYDRTEKRARRFLRGGRPFHKIRGNNRAQLTEMIKVRHAIAHASSHARSEFKSDVIEGIDLLKHEKTPAGFLRSRPNAGQTRLQIYLGIFGSLANLLR